MRKRPVFWVIAGTSEGRKLVEQLSEYDVLICVSLATEYGKPFIKEKNNISVHVGRLGREDMVSFIRENRVDCVIDTTHPFAREVTGNISAACRESKTNYLRLLREPGKDGAYIHVRDQAQAVEVLAQTEGNILLTCGSKELGKYTKLADFAERITVRILPEPDNLKKCLDLGFRAQQIICMQGPFSKELNVAMLRTTGAKILVTKDSGAAGGFNEKVEAAAELGIDVVVIGRPTEGEGLTHDQILDKLMEEYLK